MRTVLAFCASLLFGMLLSDAACAQFASVPAPRLTVQVRESAAETVAQYRRDAAKHLYALYPRRIHKGKLPPLMYAIAVVETEVDETGRVVDVEVTREPAAAKEVTPWIVSMIHKASPFPPMPKMGHVKYTEIWLVNKDGNFQLDALTEGQASE